MTDRGRGRKVDKTDSSDSHRHDIQIKQWSW